MGKISAAIIGRNSADVIEKCLGSIKGIDEIVFVDTGSEDNTKEIVSKYTDKIYDYWGCNEKNEKTGLLADFSKARNYALKFCTGDYILTIDTDEWLEPGAMKKLQAFEGEAMLIQCISDKTGETHQQPRLYKNDPEKIFWKRPIHNYLNVQASHDSDIVIHFGSNKQKKADPDRTFRILKRWIKKNRRDCLRERYYLGKEYHKREMFKEAVKQFSIYIKKSGFTAEKADALVCMARCKAGLGDLEGAVNSALGAMFINPQFKEAIELIGDLSENPNRLVWKYHAANANNYNVLFTRPKRRLKVTVLSKVDYAGSGLRIVDAVKKASQGYVDIEAITRWPGVGNRIYDIRTGPGFEALGRDAVQQRIDESDVIHFKGDWPYNGYFEGLKIPKGKKIVYTFCGSVYRRKRDGFPEQVALESYPLFEYKGDYLTAFTPELIYHKKTEWMPFPWIDFNYRFRRGKKFVIMHNPSTPSKKGTDIIMKAMDMVARDDVKLVAVNNLKYMESLEVKANSHIYIDQMVLPVYGNSAVEAMGQGIPVLSWDKGLYPIDTPVIKPKEQTAEAIAEALNEWLDWDKLEQLSKETFDYCQAVHGTVGELWIKEYKRLCNVS